MTKDHEERLVMAFERIAIALEGIDESAQTAIRKLWPERGTVPEAVITHVPTEEEQRRERQGASEKPISEWLSEPFGGEDDEYIIGERERAFLEAQRRHASPQASKQGGQDKGSSEAPESES